MSIEPSSASPEIVPQKKSLKSSSDDLLKQLIYHNQRSKTLVQEKSAAKDGKNGFLSSLI